MLSSIDALSRYLAQESGHAGDADRHAEVIVYAIKVVLLNAAATAGIILLAWLTDTVKVSLTALAAFITLRIFAGSRYHLRPFACWLLTVTVFPGLGCLSVAGAPRLLDYMHIFTALGLIFTLYVTIAFAPATIASKQFSTRKRRKLKTMAVTGIVCWAAVLLAPNTVFYTDPAIHLAVVAGLVAQAVSLLPVQIRAGGDR
ncbi:accessory gene regulator ArgB-like protein [Desulfoscipio geothermicus]|uniref:accessory gene regulator ArgB-like protein n=1 Tax=Desulfoscipio geothermicus TaxID=39060 RepID=UPI0013F4E0F0|nr:accessory gene regulator B family protein [Desulfoscipio geothermicus]